jgi:hypothetical protein
MASTSAIDTDAAGSGLCAANETSANVLGGAGTPSHPTGMYVAGTTTILTGLLADGLGTLGVKVAEGTAAAEASILMYGTTEEANQTSLST